MNSKRSTGTKIQTNGLEYLAEETQVLFQLLERHLLTDRWTFVGPSVLRELVIFLFSRGLFSYSNQRVLNAITFGLHELQDIGLIGCYQDEKTNFHVRFPTGCVMIRPNCSQADLVNNLVKRFGADYFVLDAKNRVIIGQCLRDGGYDWECMSQLNDSLDALCRHPLDLIEVFEHSNGIYIAKLTSKVLDRHEQLNENRRLRNNSSRE